MKLIDWLNKWNLGSIKLNIHILNAELKFNDVDKKAAWDLYIELLTRVAGNPLEVGTGDEQSALESLHSIFPITRKILKDSGPKAVEFTKVAIPILNQVIRPFTSKWHKKSTEGALNDPTEVLQFRKELREIHGHLVNYMKALGDIAGAGDISGLEE